MTVRGTAPPPRPAGLRPGRGQGRPVFTDTHVSALLAVRGHAAGGRLGSGDIGSLGAGAEVQLHSRPGPLCASAALPSRFPSHPFPVVVPQSPPGRNGRYPEFRLPTLAASQAPNVRAQQQQCPPRGPVPCAGGLGASELGKSVLGAWSQRAKVEISFLSEPYSPQSNQLRIKMYKALLACQLANFSWPPRRFGSMQKTNKKE